MAADVVWGYGYPTAGQGICLWVYADCSARPPLDDVFELVAQKLWKAEHEFVPRFAEVHHSVVVFGYERSESPEEELHKAYNRMWARHPELWEKVYLRGQPMSLWALDREDRPFFGVIQPARPWKCESFRVFAADCREVPENPYVSGDPVAWARVTSAIHPTTLAQAREARARE
jgi:hypothetical protein